MARGPYRILTHERRHLPIGRRKTLRIAVVADTHSKPHPETLPLISAKKPHAILHAGDVGDLGVLDELETIAPVIAVRGNIDSRDTGLPDAITLEVGRKNDPTLVLWLTHIALHYKRLRSDIRRQAQEAQAQLVVCGHSHMPWLAQDGDLAVFNPGSCGPRRFQLPILFGLISLTATGVSFQHVNCETGADWRPNA